MASYLFRTEGKSARFFMLRSIDRTAKWTQNKRGTTPKDVKYSVRRRIHAHEEEDTQQERQHAKGRQLLSLSLSLSLSLCLFIHTEGVRIYACVYQRRQHRPSSSSFGFSTCPSPLFPHPLGARIHRPRVGARIHRPAARVGALDAGRRSVVMVFSSIK